MYHVQITLETSSPENVRLLFFQKKLFIPTGEELMIGKDNLKIKPSP